MRHLTTNICLNSMIDGWKTGPGGSQSPDSNVTPSGLYIKKSIFYSNVIPTGFNTNSK